MTTIIRKLGYIESMMTVIHDELAGNTQGSQIVGIQGTIEFDHVINATHAIFDKYSALRCTINKFDNDLFFVEQNDFSQIPIKHITYDNTNDWQQYFENEVNDVIDPRKIMWRVALLTCSNSNQSKLMISVHHSIIDGTGVFVLLQDLLHFIDQQMLNKSIEFTSVGFPDPIDNYLLPATSSTPKPPTSMPPKIPFKNIADIYSRKTHIHIDYLSKNETDSIEKICKANKISLNSILTSALCLASVKNNCGNSSISFKTAVSLRDRADEPTHKLGCYIAVADTTLDITLNDIISIAKHYDKQLLSYMLKNLLRKQVGSIDQFTKTAIDIRDSNYFDHGIAITNAGSVETPITYSNFSLNDWHTINNRQAGNFALVLHVLKFNNKLNYGLVYSDPIMDADTISNISDEFLRILRDLILVSTDISTPKNIIKEQINVPV